jgi:leader peptidase (prepilin peptidase)/N-methyltransferase
METLTLIVVGLMGLAVGSYLNVVIYRMPRNRSTRRGRSVCPHCDRQLRWYHNIPLLSFLVLRGRCAYCRGRISARYPLVEAVNALFYLYFCWQYGLDPAFFAAAFLSSALLAIFFIDLDFQIIPDLITLPGMIVGLLMSLLPGGMGILSSGLGLLVGGGSLYVIAALGDKLFGKESMGGGDIKMAAMLGAFLGWQKVLLVFISSAAIGLVASVFLMIFSARLRQQRVVPFGPFLALAAIVAVIWGDRLIAYYLTSVVGVG